MGPEIRVNHSNVVAFLDLGTNSVRLMIVGVQPNHSHRILTQQKEVVRLGEGEFNKLHLQPEAMDRAVLVCRRFADLAESYGAEEIIAVATSATREAKNQLIFLNRMRQEAHIDFRVISGREEARLIYQGVSSGIDLRNETALFIDIGGGSTQLSIGDQTQHRYLDCLKLGAIRVTTIFLKGNKNPVSDDLYEQIKHYVRTIGVRTFQHLRAMDYNRALGSSGTILNLADVAARMAGRASRNNGYPLTRTELREIVVMLRELSLEKRREVPGLNPERADIIIGGAAVLETIMDELDLDELHTSERGLRDGLLVDYLNRVDNEQVGQKMSIRERSVLQLGRTCGFDETHARRVTRLALELFDSAREQELHDLDDKDRELLEYAALLHDIGAFLSYNSHHEHSHYLIGNSDLLGFDLSELHLMAAIALFHRRGLPRKKYPIFRQLDSESQRKVRLLSAFLRIAENMDRSHVGVVQSANLKRKNRKVVLEVKANKNCELELWGVQSQLKALDEALEQKVHLRMDVLDESAQQGDEPCQNHKRPVSAL